MIPQGSCTSAIKATLLWIKAFVLVYGCVCCVCERAKVPFISAEARVKHHSDFNLAWPAPLSLFIVGMMFHSQASPQCV